MKVAKRLVIMGLLGLICAGVVSAQSFWGTFSARMAVFERHGLIYNSEKESYCYNNKIAGFLVDKQGWGINVLNPAGEIHVKVNRDDAGKILNIAELPSAEYAQILEEIDALHIAMNRRREEMAQNLAEMRERLNQNRDFVRPIPPVRPGF